STRCQAGTKYGIGWPAVIKGTSNSRTAIYSGTYRAMYRIVRYANEAIQNLEGNKNITTDLDKRLLGESHFLRGLAYFYLLQLYGGVPILKKPLKPSKTYKARNTADEVRQFVIKDFENAVEALPVSYSSNSNIGRATKGAAVAMLGKAYLFNEQWSKAANEFAKLMNPPYHYELLDNYSDLFKVDNGN